MSKIDAVVRYSLIIHKLKSVYDSHKSNQNVISFEEFQDYFRSQDLESRGVKLDVSRRTFQRDISEIRSLFDLEIEYCFGERGYRLKESDISYGSDLGMRMLEALDMVNVMSYDNGFRPFMQFEYRRSLGSEYLMPLLQACKQVKEVDVAYQSFYKSYLENKTIQPYYVKEYEHRWYLIGVSKEHGALRTYALDRFRGVEITKKTFNDEKRTEYDKYFEDSFGIFGPTEYPAETVVLEFNAQQGKFVKSLPLHHSQEVVSEDKEKVVIRYKINITHDFIMEILSYGPWVKVLSPVRLVEEVKNKYRDSLNQYDG